MFERRLTRAGLLLMLLTWMAGACPSALCGEEHIFLANGFELNCSHHEVLSETGKVRLYSSASAEGASNYVEVAESSIRLVEMVEAPSVPARMAMPQASAPGSLRGLLVEAGARHHIDVDLLASLVNAESGGHAEAVSRAGARGLMQLMPGTAASLGVKDAFRPEQNVAGGTAYLDQLLTRFHDDVVLALAAYNAGPGAVDRWHGVPPYRETRAYVARIVKEYNRRKQAALAVIVH